jgi:hypothetical protein
MVAMAHAREHTAMRVTFEPKTNPHLQERREAGVPRARHAARGPNDRIALVLTAAVGTMWCAYAFAVLALLALIQWLSQTFIQLVMLSVIMVGQAILSRAADRRAELTYKDAEAAYHEAREIQEHLKRQDHAINLILERLERLAIGRIEG